MVFFSGTLRWLTVRGRWIRQVIWNTGLDESASKWSQGIGGGKEVEQPDRVHTIFGSVDQWGVRVSLWPY